MTPVRVEAIDPPFETDHGVRFGLQVGGEVPEHVPATGTAVFHTEVELVDGEAGRDVRGPSVHGRKGDRFPYLSWGQPHAPEPFVMFARATMELVDVPAELLDEAGACGGVLVCELATTNDRGQPASGSIRPPAVGWWIESAET